ncbi:MAG: hypothetical protein JKY94_10890 [Rhodobacteraceae bacterium]|nr:hypothetical protein [Paracoccaceae bacterium]
MSGDIETFKIKSNDTAPALEVTLYDIAVNGAQKVVNLGVGSTVVFNMKPKSGANPAAKVLRGTCTIVDAENGKVKYSWLNGDTDTAGKFLGEFEWTASDGKRSTYPRDGYVPIAIGQDLG